MRKLGILFAICSVLAMAADKPESVDSLKQRAEAARKGKEQIELYLKVARVQMDAADKLFDSGQVEQAQAAVTDIGTYGLKAIAQAKETHQRMKQTEIAVRKLTDHLSDMQKTLAYDDRAPVTAIIDKLDKARSDLLATMFKR